MNDEQKDQLHWLLRELLAGHKDWLYWTEMQNTQEKREARKARDSAFDAIVEFFESLGEPVTAVLDTTDPRAGLRKCTVLTLPAYFYGVFQSAEGGYAEALAIVEYALSSAMDEVPVTTVRFTDIPESGKE